MGTVNQSVANPAAGDHSCINWFPAGAQPPPRISDPFGSGTAACEVLLLAARRSIPERAIHLA